MYILNINKYDHELIQKFKYKFKNNHIDHINGFFIFYLEYKRLIKSRINNDIQIILKLIDLWNDLSNKSKYDYIFTYYNTYNNIEILY